jgi:D-alanyl-D-alanine carboxypeptidase
MLTRRSLVASALTLVTGVGALKEGARADVTAPTMQTTVTPEMLASSLQQAVDKGMPGVSAAIATRRGVVWTGVAGFADVQAAIPIDEANIFGIGSITKMFVTVVILQLVEEGRLSLDAIPADLLGAEMRGIANGAHATVGQLLAHSAGVPSWEDDPEWIQSGRGRGLDPGHIWGKQESLDYIRGPSHIALNAPGSEFHYSNSGFTILGLIIEKVTGQPAESEIRRRVLTPLDMKCTYLEGFEPGHPDRLPRRYHYATEAFRKTAGIARGFVPVRDGLIDVSPSNLSVEWVAGAMISSPRDLLAFAMALRTGLLLKPETVLYMRNWALAWPNSQIGHGLFQFNTPAGVFEGHNGNVLGFSGSLWWSENGEIATAVLANVGSMHAGETPPTASRLALYSDFTSLALSYGGQHLKGSLL